MDVGMRIYERKGKGRPDDRQGDMRNQIFRSLVCETSRKGRNQTKENILEGRGKRVKMMRSTLD